MEIYDENGNLIENPDLSLGRLETRTRTVHHDAVQKVEEVSHYEVVAEYANGGKDVRRVIDIPGVQAQDAYDETIEYQVYIPYTEEEIEQMNQPEGPSDVELLQAQIDSLTEELLAAKILLGIADEEENE